eukprot:scaffold48607_cov22-Tisochrysis_lutea.AAC.1
MAAARSSATPGEAKSSGYAAPHAQPSGALPPEARSSVVTHHRMRSRLLRVHASSAGDRCWTLNAAPQEAGPYGNAAVHVQSSGEVEEDSNV